MRKVNTIYAKVDGNDGIITVSLLLDKPIEVENLLVDEWDIADACWIIFRNAFRNMQRESLGIMGYRYDSKLSGGVQAVHQTKEGLEELLK